MFLCVSATGSIPQKMPLFFFFFFFFFFSFPYIYILQITIPPTSSFSASFNGNRVKNYRKPWICPLIRSSRKQRKRERRKKLWSVFVSLKQFLVLMATEFLIAFSRPCGVRCRLLQQVYVTFKPSLHHCFRSITAKLWLLP